MLPETTSLFFLLCITATFGYALQSSLMAEFYREMDRLSAVAYRGLSLSITMLPLLFFVPGNDFTTVTEILPLVLAAAIAAAFANWSAALTYCFLPVGIASAVSMGFATIFTLLIGVTVFDEILSLEQIALLSGILVVVILLGRSRSKGSVPREFNALKGLWTAAMFGIGISVGYSLVGATSRESHPFIVGYLWEALIGLVALAIAFIRAPRSAHALARISKQDLLRLTLYSSPTAIGTGCYAFATSIGPIGIATAILGTMMVFTTVLSKFLYKEKLSGLQWVLLLFVCLLLGLLRLSTG